MEVRSTILSIILIFFASDLSAARFSRKSPWEKVNKPTIANEQGEQVIGSYNHGCLIGGEEIPVTSNAFELVNVFRRRIYGDNTMHRFVKNLGEEMLKSKKKKIVVGDISLPVGGPMTSGHFSHQNGLDVDIRYRFISADKIFSRLERSFFPAPEIATHKVKKKGRRGKREFLLVSELRGNKLDSDIVEALKIAATLPDSQRIFVSPPIKKALCEIFKPGSQPPKVNEKSKNSVLQSTDVPEVSDVFDIKFSFDTNIMSDVVNNSTEPENKKNSEKKSESTEPSEVELVETAQPKITEMYPEWLLKIVPTRGHADHFHVRLRCPEGQGKCHKQGDVQAHPDDFTKVGCDGPLFNWWFHKNENLDSFLRDSIGLNRELKERPKPLSWEQKICQMPKECKEIVNLKHFRCPEETKPDPIDATDFRQTDYE